MKMPSFFILLSLLFVASCHVGKEYETNNLFISDASVEKNLMLTGKNSLITKEWYQLFGDEDLNTLLKFAKQANFTVKQAKERLKQSRLQYKIESKQNLPMINVTGSYNYNKTHTQNALATDTNAFKIGFDAIWEFDVWGEGLYLSKQYYELMKAAEYSLYNIQVIVTAEVSKNYINLRNAQEKLRIAKNNIVLQNDILQIIKDQYKAGIADNLALNQAEHIVEQTKALLPSLYIDIEHAKNSLAVLLGVEPKNLPIDLDNYKKNIVASTFKYSVSNLYNLPLDIIRTRPDIMMAEAEIRSQHEVINQAIVQLYPSVNLSAVFGYISPSGKSLISSDKQNYGYIPSLVTPIWHWNQLTNNVKLQEHIKNEDVLNYNEAMLTALSELKNAITAVKYSYDANRHKKISLEKMRNIMNLTKEKYKNGLVNFTDVASAEQNLLSAQTEFADSNALILKNLITFYKATGGGYNFR